MMGRKTSGRHFGAIVVVACAHSSENDDESWNGSISDGVSSTESLSVLLDVHTMLAA